MSAASIFGLSSDQLRPIVADMAGEAVTNFDVAVEREPQGFPGWAGQKLIPMFRWRTVTGQAGETVCCVKRMADCWKQEARHYAYLHTHGFPACRVYGVEHGPEGEEILFLEYLDRFWPGGSAPDERRGAALDLRAWLNALPVTPEYGATLWENPTGREWLAEGAAERMLDLIWEAAGAGEIGEAMADLCRRHRAARPALAAYARRLSERMAGMPRALSNGELCPGCPPGSEALRYFDMHSTGLAPRGADVVHFLAIPAGVHTLWGQPSWEPRAQYAAQYAAALARHGGPALSAQTVLTECRVLWEAGAFQQEWLLGLCRTGEVAWTEDREQGKAQTRAALHSQLEYLIRSTGEDAEA